MQLARPETTAREKANGQGCHAETFRHQYAGEQHHVIGQPESPVEDHEKRVQDNGTYVGRRKGLTGMMQETGWKIKGHQSEQFQRNDNSNGQKDNC